MSFRDSISHRIRLLAFAVLSAFSALPAAAEYRIASGDVLGITVFRVPELSREATVDHDGRIAIPPLGRLVVEGATLDDVGSRIQDALAREEILIDAQVTVGLVASRPVFVGGDVATPGAYPYRADISVRQAVALAGGIGIARDDRFDLVATLRGERDVAGLELLRQRLRLARVEAELADGDELVLGDDAGVAVTDGQVEAARLLEAAQLTANRAEAAEEKAHLQRSVDLAQGRIETLITQQGVLVRQLEQQTAEIDRITDIQDRGLTSQSRVMEERRAFNGMQERAAANASEIAAAREQLEEIQHTLQRFDDRRRATLLGEQQDAIAAIGSLTATLDSASERLVQLGAVDELVPQVNLYRMLAGKEVTLPANFGTILNPGDMVEIRVRLPGDRVSQARLPAGDNPAPGPGPDVSAPGSAVGTASQ